MHKNTAVSTAPGSGLSERAGIPFRFIPYLKIAFPLMLISIVFSHAYLDLRHL